MIVDLPKLSKLKAGPDCFKECRAITVLNVPSVEVDIDKNSCFRKVLFVYMSNASLSLNECLPI